MEEILIGNHPSIQKIRELISLVANTSLNVILLGETGTGKDVVARLLYQSSTQYKKRFVKVNCAALPLTLLESELFGYEKGAFTGADHLKPGKFELASEGVIFLDEIGDMPLVLQAKLLHVLQSGEFNRLGGTEDIKVNSWIIASTNHDLQKDMEAGLFREDLYYRLNIIKIELPPLRERIEDIHTLTDYFLKLYNKRFSLNEAKTIDNDLKILFQDYHWPGNIRELSSVIANLMINENPDRVKDELLDNMIKDDRPLPTEYEHRASKYRDSAPTVSGDQSNDGIRPLKILKAEATRFIEQQAILFALDSTGWNKRKAAQMLNISYKALFNKLNDYKIAK